MITDLRSSYTVAFVVGLAFLGSGPAGLASTKDDSGKGTPKPLTFRVVPEVPIPQSVFVIPSQPSKGRNPFFPQSVTRVVAPTLIKPNSVDTTLFVLNGITSPPRRTAMINGRTFESGEEGEVRLANGGKAMIKCEQIRADSAVILFD